MAFLPNICINFVLMVLSIELGKRIMAHSEVGKTATVFWVDPSAEAEYAQIPARMRVFRNVEEATSFVLRELAPIFRPDARILTADRTLMYTDIAGKTDGPLGRIARQHFGPGGQEHRKFQLAVSSALSLK